MTHRERELELQNALHELAMAVLRFDQERRQKKLPLLPEVDDRQLGAEDFSAVGMLADQYDEMLERARNAIAVAVK